MTIDKEKTITVFILVTVIIFVQVVQFVVLYFKELKVQMEYAKNAIH